MRRWVASRAVSKREGEGEGENVGILVHSPVRSSDNQKEGGLD